MHPQLARPLSAYKGEHLLVKILFTRVGKASAGYCYLFEYVREWAVEEKQHFQKCKNHVTVIFKVHANFANVRERDEFDPSEPKQADTFISTYSFNIKVQNYMVCSSLGKRLRLSVKPDIFCNLSLFKNNFIVTNSWNNLACIFRPQALVLWYKTR